jgi:hypothetical protein
VTGACARERGRPRTLPQEALTVLPGHSSFLAFAVQIGVVLPFRVREIGQGCWLSAF